ncbi:MAG: heavy-metal-associated domain-containing protein [Clostridia bacterium]|nr:heavy-metal-associated domain-containing protein [Clostridia bacterium]
MKKVTVKISGMMCGMCEAHVADAIRKSFDDAKHVKATRTKGEASFGYDGEFTDEMRAALVDLINKTGYEAGEVTVR